MSGDNALDVNDNCVFENCSAKVWGDSVQLVNMSQVCQSGEGLGRFSGRSPLPNPGLKIWGDLQ